MLYPRASICIIDLTDAELAALADGIEQERHRREIQRRAEMLVNDEKARDRVIGVPAQQPVPSQRQVVGQLRETPVAAPPM